MGERWLDLAPLDRGSLSHDTWFTIEAKFYDESIVSSTAIQGITTRLDEAADQLQRLAKDYRCRHPYSVCYVVPWSKRAEIQQGIAFLDEIATWFADKDKRCIVAKYSFGSPFPEDKGWLYPGVVFVAREGQWQR